MSGETHAGYNAAADLIERRRASARSDRRNQRFKRRQQALSVRLAERDQPHTCGNEVRHDRMQIGVQRLALCDPVPGRRHTDRGVIVAGSISLSA